MVSEIQSHGYPKSKVSCQTDIGSGEREAFLPGRVKSLPSRVEIKKGILTDTLLISARDGTRTPGTQIKNPDFSAFIGNKLAKKVVGWWSAHFEAGRNPRKEANLGADSISFFKNILLFLTR